MMDDTLENRGPKHQWPPASGERRSAPEGPAGIRMAVVQQKEPYSSTCSCYEFDSLILYELPGEMYLIFSQIIDRLIATNQAT